MVRTEFLVAGTTGESPNLSAVEKIELFKVVKEAVGDSCQVIAGVGTYSTAESIELTKESSKLDIDGILAVVPYYNKPSQEGLYEHFKAIAQNTDLPVMLYNIPGRTAVNLQPSTVSRLAQIPNILSIKEAAGSMDQVSELKSVLPANFSIYAGDDSLTLPVLALGGAGVVSVASHLVGIPIAKMIKAFLNGEFEKALRWHLLLYPIFKGLFITTNPVPVKYLLNEIGFNAGSLRLPLVDPYEEEKAELKELLNKIQALPEEI
jgi:4-hydroxy-tetrahydrodipicolinate synthase